MPSGGRGKVRLTMNKIHEWEDDQNEKLEMDISDSMFDLGRFF
jgi:hypothetical protein